MSHGPQHTYSDPAAPARHCLNCETALSGPYCARCGQQDIEYHRSFGHFVHEVLENFFHFDGKFLTSVAWLLGKPGQLTVDFNAGRRQSQVPPLRFYIFVTVLFFLGLQIFNHGHLIDIDWRKTDKKITPTLKALEENLRPTGPGPTQAQIEEFARRYAAARPQNPTREQINAIAQEVFGPENSGVAPTPVTNVPGELNPNAASPAPPAKKTPTRTNREPGLFRKVSARVASGDLTASEIWTRFEHQVPTALFLGMPVFALLLKLIYWRRHRYYIEHLVFSIHLHAWVFLVFMVATGYLRLSALGPTWLLLAALAALLLWMVWYVVAAFRAVYAQGWLKTTFKVVLLGGSYTCALLFILSGLALLTLQWLVMA